MKKVVRLTESDLVRLVNKVIEEQNKYELDPEDLKVPNEDKLRNLFLSKNETPEIKKMANKYKKAMQSCISEKNLYKVGGLLDNVGTKKMNVLNTIMSMLFDKKMGGKSLGQEFNEFGDCVNKKIGGELKNMF